MRYLVSFQSYNENVLNRLFNKLFKKTPGKDISHKLPSTFYKPSYIYNKDRYKISDEQILEIKDMFLDVADEYSIEYDPKAIFMKFYESETAAGLIRPKYFIERIGENLITLKFSIVSPCDWDVIKNEKFIKEIDNFKNRVSLSGYQCENTRVCTNDFIGFYYLYFFISVSTKSI